MDFEYSDRTKALLEKLNKFMDEVIYPAEPVYEELPSGSFIYHFCFLFKFFSSVLVKNLVKRSTPQIWDFNRIFNRIYTIMIGNERNIE